MDNKDLIKQYVDTGQQIGKYQFNRLPDNMKVTYLRKRIIATEQDEDYKLNRYEMVGAPESYKPEMVKYLLSKMETYFSMCDYEKTEDEKFNFKYGDLNPVVADIMRGDETSPKNDIIIIEFTHNPKFLESLNKKTIYRILNYSANPEKVFPYLGSMGEYYKNYTSKNGEKNVIQDVIYSKNPVGLMKVFSNLNLDGYFKSLPIRDKMYDLSSSMNPKAMLPILGYDIIDYIKEQIKKGNEGNLIHHLLNNATNHIEMEDIFDEYGIEHYQITKYYSRK